MVNRDELNEWIYIVSYGVGGIVNLTLSVYALWMNKSTWKQADWFVTQIFILSGLVSIGSIILSEECINGKIFHEKQGDEVDHGQNCCSNEGVPE